jgi:phenylalanyl-tRNA synthetase beta chain
MKVSLNWVRFINQKYHTAADPAPDGVDKLVEKIGAQLGAVEEVIDLGKKYEKALIVKVVECVKHPDADKLSLCKIDAGKKELILVVCGAPNVKAGMLAVWLPPGATVPSTYDKDPFVLEAREIRGQMSSGMLASPRELALGDSHEGILEIEDDVKPGASFAAACGLDDHVIDIENKMFTHRPDLFGVLGIARELAGIQGQVFKSPDWYREDAALNNDGRSNGLKLEIKNELPKLVPRFCAVAIKDVKVAESPLWLKVRLNAAGIRPINNIVDITNFMMMETAQPLHAYDYDKVKTGTIGVRLSRKGEKLALLNGKTITLADGAMLITDGEKPIGLGGVMGGADTEVDENTKNIILECANFDMNQTRKATMEYGLFTDAATRFTKNQSPRQNLAVLVKTVDDIKRVAGGRVASQVIDDKHFEVREKPVKTDLKFINSRLGLNLSVTEVKKTLENVEFDVSVQGDVLSVKAPFWRTDIEIPEDIVEEIGRLHGYDKLPRQLPKRTIAPAWRNRLMDFKDQLRLILSETGANEVLTYSFVPQSLIQRTNQDSKHAYKLSNALSPSLQYYRFNLIPSLLEKVHPNVKAGFDRFALFEIGKGHDKDHQNEEKLPEEFELLSLVYSASAKSKPAGPAFFEAKAFLLQLARQLGLELIFKPVEELPKAPLAQAYEPRRTAMVSADDGTFLGIIGEFKQSVRRQLKLSGHSAGWEIDIQALLGAVPAVRRYSPLPRYPQTSQDLTLNTDASLSYQNLSDQLRQYLQQATAAQGYLFKFEPLDIYIPEDSPDNEHTTWRITFWHPDKTLTTEEVNRLMDKVAEQAKLGLKAERI